MKHNLPKTTAAASKLQQFYCNFIGFYTKHWSTGDAASVIQSWTFHHSFPDSCSPGLLRSPRPRPDRPWMQPGSLQGRWGCWPYWPNHLVDKKEKHNHTSVKLWGTRGDYFNQNTTTFNLLFYSLWLCSSQRSNKCLCFLNHLLASSQFIMTLYFVFLPFSAKSSEQDFSVELK